MVNRRLFYGLAPLGSIQVPSPGAPWRRPSTAAGRNLPMHPCLGRGHGCPGRVGAPPAPPAGRGGGSRPQPRGASCAPAHLREQTEKAMSACSVSVHIPGTRLLLPAPTRQYADIKATAKRQLVRDPLIYVMLNVGRSKLGGGGKNISVAAFNARFKNQGLMFL